MSFYTLQPAPAKEFQDKLSSNGILNWYDWQTWNWAAFDIHWPITLKLVYWKQVGIIPLNQTLKGCWQDLCSYLHFQSSNWWRNLIFVKIVGRSSSIIFSLSTAENEINLTISFLLVFFWSIPMHHSNSMRAFFNWKMTMKQTPSMDADRNGIIMSNNQKERPHAGEQFHLQSHTLWPK